MEKNSVFKHAEKQKIESLCDNSIDEIINGLDREKFKEVNKKDIKIDVNNIYKVYLPEDNFIKKCLTYVVHELAPAIFPLSRR
jgi:hypothetical protein